MVAYIREFQRQLPQGIDSFAPLKYIARKIKAAVFLLFRAILHVGIFSVQITLQAIAQLSSACNRTRRAFQNRFHQPPPVRVGYYPSRAAAQDRPLAPLPQAPAPKKLNELASYKNLPTLEEPFIIEAIKLYRNSLSPLKNEKNPLSPQETFDDEFETMENVAIVAFAVVRAYVFSDNSDHFTSLLETNKDGVVTASYREQLLNLRTLFNEIAPGEQEIIYNKKDPNGISQLPISVLSKMILTEMAAIANFLQQNQKFIQKLPPLAKLTQEV